MEGILAVCEEVCTIRASRIECAAEREKISVVFFFFNAVCHRESCIVKKNCGIDFGGTTTQLFKL